MYIFFCSDFSSNHTGSIKRLAVVQHFLTTCQRLRDLCNGCSGFRVSFFGRQPELSSARVAVSSGVQSCGNIKDTGTSGCADLTTAIDAMETVMGRMVLNLDDAAAIRMKMEQLLSSGTLRPLTDMLVNRLRHIIPEYDCPQEKFVYAIVERSLKIFLGQLLDGVVAELNGAPEEGTPSSSISNTEIHGGDLSLLTTAMTQYIMNNVSGRPRDCSGDYPPTRDFSSRISGTSDQDSVENCKVTACTECPEGKDYFSLVSIVLVQLMRKIEPTIEHMADFTAFHSDLTERILSEFCSTSGLSRDKSNPAVRIQKMCNNIYNELLKSFRTKAMVSGLLAYRQPVLSTVLTKCLVKELLRVSQEEVGAERTEGAQRFSFLHRLKAFKTLILKVQ